MKVQMTVKMKNVFLVFLVFCLVFCFTFCPIGVKQSQAADDLIYAVVPTTLNTSTYVPVVVGTQPAYGFSVALNDADLPWYIATNAAGTDGELLPAGTKITWNHKAMPGSTVFYAKLDSGTGKILLLPGRVPGF